MDRNGNHAGVDLALGAVALRKESVDRNGAWRGRQCINGAVALRKESVDRNPYVPLAKVRHCESLSARRAWIEMTGADVGGTWQCVALRKESVDRNICDHLLNIPAGSRSPQGERG